LRILLSCLQSPRRYAIPAYDFWRGYFVPGIREAGHEAVEVPGVDWAEGLAHPAGPQLLSWQARTWQAVHDFVDRQPVDLFLSYLFPQQIDTAALDKLQCKGVPCVNFFCDNLREFHNVPVEFTPFALHWVPEFEALPMYRAAGLRHVHAPMPCWVPPALRTVPRKAGEPPTFIGSADPLRADLLSRALRLDADFIVRGAGWETDLDQVPASAKPRRIGELLINQRETMRRHGIVALLRKLEDRIRPLPHACFPASTIGGAPRGSDEYFRLTRKALVTIGVNRVPTARASRRRPLAYSRLRDIEAPMLGACYLTEWTEGLARLYELGTEIETYRTANELADKLRELRQSPTRRAELRARGQRRALEDHSIKHSLAQIATHLGLKSG
jgi:hypothetical protein